MRVPSVSPYLVPALAVSLLLNLVTGGAIITNYIEPTSRSDEETRDPYQVRYIRVTLNRVDLI